MEPEPIDLEPRRGPWLRALSGIVVLGFASLVALLGLGVLAGSEPAPAAAAPVAELVPGPADELAAPTVRVTTFDQLRGDWRPLTLFGKWFNPIDYPNGRGSISFFDRNPATSAFGWASSGGVGSSSGAARLERGHIVFGGWINYVGPACETEEGDPCPQVPNGSALDETDSALLNPATGHLLLLDESGAVVGTFEREPRVRR